MIDFHTHILPGMDDGYKSADDAIEALNIMYNNGVRTVALTPHYYHENEDIPAFLERREKSYSELQQKISDSGIEVPELIVGAEVLFFRGMSRNEDIQKLCYDGTNVILVEMPFEKWGTEEFLELQKLSVNCGLTPLIAHVNRYLYYGNKISDIMKHQLPIQINTEAFFANDKKEYLKLSKKSNCIVLGSDTHDLVDRPPNYHLGVQVIAKKYGFGPIDRIVDTGRLILNI